MGSVKNYVVQNNVTGQNDTSQYIDQYIDPRLILGVSLATNSQGQCYHATNNPYKLPSITLDTSSSYGYYESENHKKSITLNDEIFYSCVDEFDNVTMLQTYCENQGWKTKELFNNIRNVTHVARFGNPNNLFIKDWIEIVAFNIDNQNSIWDSVQQKCLIPAIFNIDILYATYGSTNNTQISIERVSKRLEYL